MISTRILARTRCTTPALTFSRQPLRHRLQSTASQSPRPSNDSWTTKAVLALASLLGYNSPKQNAQRNALMLYRQYVKPVEKHEQQFWVTSCSLPPTFQTWFTITNLHIWLLTVRLRALPAPHGRHYVQGLINHFFEDVEDQIRSRLHKRVSERIVTRELKICRDQWQGLGLALDYGLLSSDTELAAAVWRNFLGARGASGIDGRGQAINYAGLEEPTERVNQPRDEEADDNSGVRDFEGAERDKYLEYPELMWTLVSYIRQEVCRLEAIPDETILHQISIGSFGSIRENVDPIPTSN